MVLFKDMADWLGTLWWKAMQARHFSCFCTFPLYWSFRLLALLQLNCSLTPAHTPCPHAASKPQQQGESSDFFTEKSLNRFIFSAPPCKRKHWCIFQNVKTMWKNVFGLFTFYFWCPSPPSAFFFEWKYSLLRGTYCMLRAEIQIYRYSNSYQKLSAQIHINAPSLWHFRLHRWVFVLYQALERI